MHPSFRALVPLALAFAVAVGLSVRPGGGELWMPPAHAAAGSGTIAAPNVQAGTTPSAMVTIILNETAPADYPAVGPISVVVSIFDGAGNDRLGFVGTPTVFAPGSLAGRSVTVGSGALDNQLTISWTGSDVQSLEPISISGLRVSAASNAVAGPIRAFYTVSGLPAGYYGAGSWTASGSLAFAEATGSSVLEVNGDPGSFPFTTSGFGNGLLNIAAPVAESIGVTAVLAGPVLLTNPLVVRHAAGTRVWQSVSVSGTLTTLPVAAKAATLTQTVVGQTTVASGTTDQAAGAIRLTESAAGAIVAGSVLTFTIATPGVQFTSAPQVDPDGRLGVANQALGAPATCALNSTRTNCSVIVTTASVLTPGTIELTGIRLDASPTLPGGTGLGIATALVPGLTVSVVNRTVAVVSSSVIGTSLTAPGTATGATTTGPFDSPTPVTATNKYVTWKFQLVPAVTAARIEIWVATNSGAGWTAFKRLTVRLTDTSGAAYFWWRSSSAERISVRGYYPGNATRAAAWSPARQARWR